MKKTLLTTVSMLAITALALPAFAKEEGKKGKGEELFKQHCAVCHPDGGNIVNPKKTLKKADLQANGIKSAKDIIKNMRNPGPGMNKFDDKTIPEKDAKAIAEYILKTFK